MYMSLFLHLSILLCSDYFSMCRMKSLPRFHSGGRMRQYGSFIGYIVAIVFRKQKRNMDPLHKNEIWILYLASR